MAELFLHCGTRRLALSGQATSLFVPWGEGFMLSQKKAQEPPGVLWPRRILGAGISSSHSHVAHMPSSGISVPLPPVPPLLHSPWLVPS